jgi:hypothetical protein
MKPIASPIAVRKRRARPLRKQLPGQFRARLGGCCRAFWRSAVTGLDSGDGKRVRGGPGHYRNARRGILTHRHLLDGEHRGPLLKKAVRSCRARSRD